MTLEELQAVMEAWPTAGPVPELRGRLRSVPEDFEVEEELGFTPDGEGEHSFLWVEKRGANTEYVAKQLAAWAGVRSREVSYAGLKDRHAVARQWFSVHLPGREPDTPWEALESGELRILEVTRHTRKLRRGALKGNRFRLLLREVQGDRQGWQARIARLQAHGAPNYFGPQRFGRGGGNLLSGVALMAGEKRRGSRQQQGLYLSALRSFLFNQVLSARVADGSWETALDGEALILDGTRSWFLRDREPQWRERMDRFDLHPSGPLWGRGSPCSEGQVAELETRVCEPWADWCVGLEAKGLNAERRALRLPAPDLSYQWLAEDQLELCFRLPAGTYATTLLRELVQV